MSNNTFKGKCFQNIKARGEAHVHSSLSEFFFKMGRNSQSVAVMPGQCPWSWWYKLFGHNWGILSSLPTTSNIVLYVTGFICWKCKPDTKEEAKKTNQKKLYKE